MYMELFNEVKNRYFQLVLKVINEAAEGKSKADILRIIDEGEFEQKVIGSNQQSFAGLMVNDCKSNNGSDENYNFLTEDNGKFYPTIAGSDRPAVPIRFTNIEKAWLKALINEPCVKLVMKESTIKKLEKQLENIDTPIKSEYIEMTNILNAQNEDDNKSYQENFEIILKAILKEKPIRYNNTDKSGRVYENMTSIPVSIEYSMRDKRFRLSMYSIDSKRPVMANIFSMDSIKIVDDLKSDIDRETARKILYDQKYSPEPIVLIVTDEKAAMERCFMSFSGMERTSKCIGKNKYEIKLYYYLFEEENLIRNILSLGPYVKVISPVRIADEIISRVQKSIELLKIN